MGGAFCADVVFETDIKTLQKAFMTLKASGPNFILSTKSESASLIYLKNMIKIVRDSYGLT